MIGHNQINIPQPSQSQPAPIVTTESVTSSAQQNFAPKPSLNRSSNNQMSSINSVNPLQNTSNNSVVALSTSNRTNNNAPPLLTCTEPPNPLQELLSLFECPVCFEFALPPIIQCQSGHIVCSNCRPKLTCCPTCRSTLGNIRNLSMEKIAYSLKFPCKYTSYGCKESMSHENKLEHEDICEFRMYNCPCPGASCKWQVDKSKSSFF